MNSQQQHDDKHAFKCCMNLLIILIIALTLAAAVLMKHDNNLKTEIYKAKVDVCMVYDDYCILNVEPR